MELKDLENDKAIKEKLSNLRNSVQKIKKILDTALEADTSQFSLKDQVEFDLFLTYALNALYWMYLKTKGEDPNFHDVKNQLARVKDYMVKAKQADERNTIRPKVNQAVAARFVKHGIHHKEEEQPPNKKIKFAD
ncbi:nuclear nucleic acid-binding protein C1D-like [Dendroctonus ponderosae]|uniref:Nuclear nucleic acid-binding protein C1D n=1 Tax=Dendroctonus ponderosae TaxID=77166 RepID=J3JV10_DENPD